MSRPVVLLLLAAALRSCTALVRLHSSFSFTFLDSPARFGPRVGGDGICGSLHAADPAEACAPIKHPRGGAGRRSFVLIARGNCSFENKVWAAQRAGFDAAVVYDDEEKASLYSRHSPISLPLVGANFCNKNKRRMNCLKYENIALLSSKWLVTLREYTYLRYLYPRWLWKH